MDLEDDTTVLTTLKSFNSFIRHSEAPQRLSEHSAGSVSLQSQYKRSMEVNRKLAASTRSLSEAGVKHATFCTPFFFKLLEAAEKVQSKNRYLQLDQEKRQMELSHKRARYELERAASDSARDFEVQVASIPFKWTSEKTLGK